MVVRRTVEMLDRSSGASPLLRAGLRYLFPDNWSFLLGEVALYAFMVLIGTGVYLALYFSPSFHDVIYNGPYVPLKGQHMSEAYRSVMDISFNYRAGLLIRQAHHWAADIFLAAMLIHLMRVFFTGAYRHPRTLTWLIGLGILTVSLLEGYAGYSMVDDLLSGMGLAIGYGVALSIPFFGANLAELIWGGEYPGSSAFESRLYIAHVFILPVIIGTLLALHLGLVAWRHHTQYRESRRNTNRRIIGAPAFPAQVPRSLGLMFAVVALLFLLGGLVQINPIWQWGPYEVWKSTNGAQPDFYLGWLIGALRLMPSFDWVIDGYTLVPNPFWGGVMFPGIVFTFLGAWPFLERRLSRDRRVHNVLDRPRDNPLRTASGMAMLTWVLVMLFAGSADRAYVFFDVPYVSQIWVYRGLVFIAPVVAFLVTRRACLELQRIDRVEQAREEEEHAAEAEYEAELRARGRPPMAELP
jgi:ubiquinol-cytochrome c reductase cytochrome b subunit